MRTKLKQSHIGYAVSHQLLGTLIVLQERMFIGPGSWSFRLPTSHLRHRCKGQHPWSSGKIRFLVGCGNPRFIPRPWIHSNSKLPAPNPYYIFARIHKFQLAWMATCGNIPTVNEQGEKVCVQASLSLSFMLFKTTSEMQLSYHSRNQIGKSERSTCHR